IVNSGFSIHNRTGTILFGPVQTNTLWSGFGGFCQTDNDGDAIVLYDSIADRWFITQFAVTNGNKVNGNTQCVAVSQTADPTGAWRRFSFTYTGLPDYGKFGVWPDGYYATYHLFNPNNSNYLGERVCVFDRAAMLAGSTATQQCFNAGTSVFGVLPSDLDGPT